MPLGAHRLDGKCAAVVIRFLSAADAKGCALAVCQEHSSPTKGFMKERGGSSLEVDCNRLPHVLGCEKELRASLNVVGALSASYVVCVAGFIATSCVSALESVRERNDLEGQAADQTRPKPIFLQ